MSVFWLLLSDVALLVVVGGLAVVVLVLARQIGVLHERTAPAGALMQKAGEVERLDLAGLQVENLAGEALDLQHVSEGRGLSLLFVGPDCPVCGSLLPGYESMLADLSFVCCWVGNAQPMSEQMAYADRHGLDKTRYLVTPQLGINLQVMQTPTLVIVDAGGNVVVREKLRGPKQLAALAARLQGSAHLHDGESHRGESHEMA
jgi:methylamine dehydrogenase accessory protein MauD